MPTRPRLPIPRSPSTRCNGRSGSPCPLKTNSPKPSGARGRVHDRPRVLSRTRARAAADGWRRAAGPPWPADRVLALLADRRGGGLLRRPASRVRRLRRRGRRRVAADAEAPPTPSGRGAAYRRRRGHRRPDGRRTDGSSCPAGRSPSVRAGHRRRAGPHGRRRVRRREGPRRPSASASSGWTPSARSARGQTECADKNLHAYDACRTEQLPDGSRLLLHQGYEYPDRRADTKVWRAVLVTAQGFLVDASEWNAAADKGASVSRTDPPLTIAQLKAWSPRTQLARGAERPAGGRARAGAPAGVDRPAGPECRGCPGAADDQARDHRPDRLPGRAGRVRLRRARRRQGQVPASRSTSSRPRAPGVHRGSRPSSRSPTAPR